MPLFKKDKKEKEPKNTSDDGSGGASTVERSSKLTPEQVESFGAPRSNLITSHKSTCSTLVHKQYSTITLRACGFRAPNMRNHATSCFLRVTLLNYQRQITKSMSLLHVARGDLNPPRVQESQSSGAAEAI